MKLDWRDKILDLINFVGVIFMDVGECEIWNVGFGMLCSGLLGVKVVFLWFVFRLYENC